MPNHRRLGCPHRVRRDGPARRWHPYDLRRPYRSDGILHRRAFALLRGPLLWARRRTTAGFGAPRAALDPGVTMKTHSSAAPPGSVLATAETLAALLGERAL